MQPIRDDDRPELESPVVQGLAQAVSQQDPPFDLRSRVLRNAAAGTQLKDRRSPASYVPWLATAASLALAAGLTLYTGQLRARIGVLEDELRDARARADATERQMADARRAVASAHNAVAVLTAPDVARIDLAGEAIAPKASARAFWSRSRGMVFTASNLPALPPGRTYQLWVVTAQQAPISAGLLTPDAAGNVSDTFNTPQDLPQPVAIAVTIEPAGGVPAPTGERYLVGKV